jgi:uncharacterized membrane protein YkvA (DUF1232 family)
MVREVVRGRYRDVPRGALIAILAGLVYFANSLDAIPDLLPVSGLLDAAAVFT